MVGPVKIGFDNAFQNPGGRAFVAKTVSGLFQGVRDGSSLTESVGMVIRQGFRHRFKSEGVKSLHSSVPHGGDTEVA